MKLTVHLVTWNGAKYIPLLFESLRTQSFKDWELVVLDNASTDNTAELVAKELSNWNGLKQFTKSLTNTGFAGGHNLLYSQTESEYFLLLNQDFYLEPNCIEKLLTEIESQSELAVVSPRLMKWDFLNQKFTNTIDSLGLKVFRNRRVIELDGGEEWQDKGQKTIKVFGVSGAAPLFRRAAISKIAFSQTEFLDGSYGSYKEDVDLAFRLQSAGYEAKTVLGAVIYHDRSASGPVELSDVAAAENKKQQSAWIQYHSYKNHLMTVYKNEYWQNLTLDFSWILWYELKKFLWFLFFKPSVLKGLIEIWKNRKLLQQKRILIKKHRQSDWKKMREFWN